LFLDFSSKLPDPVVVLSDGKFSMDKRVKILCPFIGDLLSSALDESPTIIIPDFHSRTFNCIGSILVQGYGEYYSHDVKEVVELGRALNIGKINSVSVSKVGDGKDSEEGSILTDNEIKKNEIVARIKMNMPESKAPNLIEGIVPGANEYYEDIKVELKVEIESKANMGDINSGPLVGKVADGEDVHDECEEGEIVSDEKETKEKEIVSRIEMAEFSKIFQDIPNIVSKNQESFTCKDCIKSFSSLIALNSHFTAKHSSHPCVYCNRIFQAQSSLNYHIIAKHTKKALRRYQKRVRTGEIAAFNTDPKRKHRTKSIYMRKKGRVNRERKPLKPMDNMSGPFTETVESLIVDKGDDQNAIAGVNLYYVLHKKEDSARNIDSRPVLRNPGCRVDSSEQ